MKDEGPKKKEIMELRTDKNELEMRRRTAGNPFFFLLYVAPETNN